MPDKSSEDFIRYIDGSLKDGLLSEAEWTVKLESAPSYDLSVEQAKRLLIERCVESGAVIEHFEIQKLRDLIAITAPDKVLEASVQALLRRLAEERYRHTKLASPQAHVDQLVGERLSEAKLREEKPLRQKINERLHASAGPSRSLGIEDWRRLYSEMLQELGIPGDETSYLVGLFLDCRRELQVKIAEPEPQSEVPAPPPPVDERPPLPRPVHQATESSSGVLAALGRVVLISLLVAVIVFFILMFLDRGAGSVDENSISISYPPCDGVCVTNLQTWTEELKQAPSPEVLGLAAKMCEPYLRLPEDLRRGAKDENPAWKHCEYSLIVDEFEKFSS